MASVASVAAYSRADVERMVSDAVRSRTGASSSTMSTDDRVRTFVSELKTLVAKCFGDLNSMVKEKFSGAGEQLERFGRGLSVIENWDAGVRAEETQRALARFPYIADEYKYTVITFVRSLVQNDESQKVRIPPFDMFLFYYFREVARSPVMRQGAFFVMSYLEQDAFLRDTLHVVLRDCAQLLKTKSIAGGGGDGSSSCVSTASVHPAWRAALAPPHAAQSTRVIQPADSVSNIGQTQTPRAAAAAALPHHQHQRHHHHSGGVAEKQQSVHPSDSVSNVGGRAGSAMHPVPRVPHVHPPAQETRPAAPKSTTSFAAAPLKSAQAEDKVVDTSVVGTSHVEEERQQRQSNSTSVASLRFYDSDQDESGSDFDDEDEDNDEAQ